MVDLYVVLLCQTRESHLPSLRPGCRLSLLPCVCWTSVRALLAMWAPQVTYWETRAWNNHVMETLRLGHQGLGISTEMVAQTIALKTTAKRPAL